MSDVCETFKAIGEPTRFRILRLLIESKGDLCACELSDALEKPQYTISKSVGALVSRGLIGERREGRMMFYRLVRGPVNDALFAAVGSVPADEQSRSDAKRLKARLAERSGGECVRC